MSATPDPSSSSTSAFPLNRLVAFAGPYVAVLSGIIANWLVVHVHLLAEFHITSGSVASAISQIAVFGITTLVVWAGHQKWLTGWQKWESEILPEVVKIVDDANLKASVNVSTPAPKAQRRPAYKSPAQDE